MIPLLPGGATTPPLLPWLQHSSEMLSHILTKNVRIWPFFCVLFIWLLKLALAECSAGLCISLVVHMYVGVCLCASYGTEGQASPPVAFPDL